MLEPKRQLSLNTVINSVLVTAFRGPGRFKGVNSSTDGVSPRDMGSSGLNVTLHETRKAEAVSIARRIVLRVYSDSVRVCIGKLATLGSDRVVCKASEYRPVSSG